MAMALSQRNDEAEAFFQTATPALREDTVCPGTDDPLTRIPSGESIWGSRSKKDRLLKNQ